MQPIFMTNDLGGVVFLGKDKIVLRFSKGVTHTVRVNTKEILALLKTRSEQVWKNEKILIEPMYLEIIEGKVRSFTQITFKNTPIDSDIADVFQTDLESVLEEIERDYL
ncbi:MAG TPA: hypothetical protein PLI45_00440 [Candidatus Woesebacteria bacterium]|nr:hypothetical protein [Candidatus Woesebacteria bacterium]